DRAPENTDVLSALEGIYRQTGDLPALYDVIARRADVFSGDVAAELPLRAQQGELAVKLGRGEDAVAAYERVWSLRPGDPGALAALDALYSEGRQWSDLAGLLERDLALGMPEHAAVGAHFRLAQIEASHQGNRAKALEHLEGVLRGQ